MIAKHLITSQPPQYVSLLVRGETAIVDSSTVAANTLTTGGAAPPTISSTQSKMGTSSLQMTISSTISISNPYALDFGAGQNFTLEAWIFPTATNSNGWVVLDARNAGGTSQMFVFGLQISTGYKTYFFSAGASVVGTIAVSINTWTHIAAVRNNGVVTLYTNGVANGTLASTGAIHPPGPNLPIIGAKDTQTAFNPVGFIDGLRVTKGFAVYTSNFTPPTSYPTEPTWPPGGVAT